MGEAVHFASAAFDGEFTTASLPGGRQVQFTRAERLLLRAFAARPGMVLTRDQLLDAVAGPGSASSDRNVDFTINRVRKKLGDSARDPVFIATRYGEGYVWVAKPRHPGTAAVGAFLVVGPFRGAPGSGTLAGLTQRFAEGLASVLDARTAADAPVVVVPDCPAPEAFPGEKPRFGAELCFLHIGDRLDCAITVRVFASGRIVHVARAALLRSDSVDASDVAEIAEGMLAAVWEYLTYPHAMPSAAEPPLPVRIHDAARQLADYAMSPLQAVNRLRTMLAEDPRNPRTKLLLATALHSKYVMAGAITAQNDFRASDEAEMERLTVDSLPQLQHNPIFAMAAAKLLYFIGRGHKPLAVGLAVAAFESTTAFVTSFAVLGQIRGFQGDIESAVELYDRGLDLCPDRSEIQLYFLMLKCTALLAHGDRARLESASGLLYEKIPPGRGGSEYFFVSDDASAADPAALEAIDRMGPERAAGVLRYVNYVSARHYELPEHRANVLKGLVRQVRVRYGPAALPDELRHSVPTLVNAV